MQALVVLSGGQDSTTCLYEAKRLYADVRAITFDYGQKHMKEIECAKAIAKLAGCLSHDIVEVPGVLHSVSPLVNKSTELEKYTDFESMDRIIGERVELTFVPMRNAMFLVIAANYAVHYGIRDIVTGVCQADNANYPDCRQTFIHAAQQMIRESMGDDGITIVTPLMFRTKADTVRFAHSLPGCWEALAYTMTSYDGNYPPTDNNHANVLRAHGFEEAGMPDPLVLRAVSEGLMALPATANYDNERRV